MTEEEFQELETQIRHQHEGDLESLIQYLRSKLVTEEEKKEPPE